MRRSHLLTLMTATTLAGLVSLSALAADGLRDEAVGNETQPPPMLNEENDDLRRQRFYPTQPPTIPHKVSEYRIDVDSNKCLFCHSRTKAPEMKAPMLSVTHFQDRDGNMLADVSAQRYFCTQCHVAQQPGDPILGSNFLSIDQLPPVKQQQGE